MKNDIIKHTLNFSVIGIFISGFTAAFLLGLQILLTSFGIECSKAWKTIWIFSIFSTITLPIFFYYYLNKLTKKSTLIIYLFNLLEYIFLQASFIFLLTSPNIICYGHGGQNGLELIITAWIGLPILIGLSFIFSKISKQQN